jgi:hypothetical protein
MAQYERAGGGGALCSQNGEAKALQIARLELQKAWRARSRKRFDFWTAVAQQMEFAARGESGGNQGRVR